jgi:hypothetical protein
VISFPGRIIRASPASPNVMPVVTLPTRVSRRLDARAAGESRSGFIAHLTLETTEGLR